MALTTAEIQKFITADICSKKKRIAAEGQRYYEAEHDILQYRMFYYNADGKLVEDTMRSNSKICHPFFTELTDQLTFHLLSFNKNPIRAKENIDGLQDQLDTYFNARFWREIGDLVTGAYAKGFEYLYGYKGKENRTVFQCADSLGVIEIKASDADDQQDHILYWYIDCIEKGEKVVKKIQDWTKDATLYYVQIDNGKIVPDEEAEINPRPHIVFTDKNTGQKMGYGYGFIPFWRLDNNRKQFSGLKPIKHLIDDYDLHACSLSNNLVDFDTPLHVVRGFQGHGEKGLDELQKNLKTKKIVAVDEEGGVEVHTVDIPYQARKEKLEIDERGIYKFGMGFNASQTGDGNITNVVIQSRYSLLDMKAGKMQDRLEALLEEIIPVVLDEINAEKGTGYEMADIFFDFKRDTITNESENIQNEKIRAETQQIRINTILNMAAEIGEDTVLRKLCDEFDLDYKEVKAEIEKQKEDQSLNAARTALKGGVIDEPPTITGTGTLS